MKTEKYEELCIKMESLLSDEPNLISVLSNAAALIHDTFDFWWTGFYLVENDELILGPFQGPVACMHIAKGRGVCGTAWVEGRTIIVPDVDKFPGHIACSSASRSEIVVPVYYDGLIMAVLDVDSVTLDSFDEVDAMWLEKICSFIWRLCLFYIFHNKNIVYLLNYRNAMQGTIKTVRQIITSWGRGHIFFTDDFSMLESQGSVRIALSQLSAEGFIVRLARGIYCYPEIVGKHFSKTIVPDEEMIALALAAKERIRLIPYGDQAAYKLGITTLRVSDLNYLTDGPPRKIKVLKGRTIYFNHTSEVKIFDYRNETMQSVCSAIRALGYDRIGEREKRIIRNKLRAVSEQDFARDLMIAPAWVQEIVRELWKN